MTTNQNQPDSESDAQLRELEQLLDYMKVAYADKRSVMALFKSAQRQLLTELMEQAVEFDTQRPPYSTKAVKVSAIQAMLDRLNRGEG